MRSIVVVFSSIVIVFAACRKDDPAPEPVGPDVLHRIACGLRSDEVRIQCFQPTIFFEGELANMIPVQGVLPFEPLNLSSRIMRTRSVSFGCL